MAIPGNMTATEAIRNQLEGLKPPVDYSVQIIVAGCTEPIEIKVKDVTKEYVTTREGETFRLSAINGIIN